MLLAYTVQEGDLDSDGISIGANRFSLNGGTIWDKTGNHADLTHGALPANGGHRVEGLNITSPAVSSISISSNPGRDGAYAIGDEIKLTVAFSEEVTVSGTPQLELGVGGEARTAEYEGSDGATLVFSYTVSEGDEATHGIAMGEDSLHVNGASIEDAAGNPAALTHEAFRAGADHRVDGVRPAFANAEISQDGTEVTVSFSEEVALSSVL